MFFVGVALCRKCDKGDTVLVSPYASCAYIYFESIQSCTFQTMAGTSLVVVVDDIDLSATRTAIAGSLSIIHHAVAKIDVLCLHGVLPFVGAVFLVGSIACPSISCTIETRATVHEMSYEVVVETCQLTTPDAAIAVCSFGVTWIGEAFGYSTPLHGEVVVVIERSHLVDTPAEGAVVVDDAGLVALPCGISSVVDVLLLSTANAKEADDVVVARLNRIIAQGDAW
ncbi:unknown [Prevotella sp. CAG:604]|nr:unknown [Prevotella sp. CAG:604]